MKSNSTYAHLALFTVGLIYAANYFIAKGLMPDLIGPSGFIALRVIGGGLMFWVLMAFLGIERIEKSDLPRFVVCGLTGVAINQLCFFNGLAITSPVHASLIMSVNPIFVLITSYFVLGIEITRRKLIGIGLGAVGATSLLLLSSDAGITMTGASVKGDLLILVNALSYGVYLVAVKPLMKKYKPLTVIAWVFLFGGLIAVPFGFGEVMEINWEGLEMAHWQSIVFVIVGTTFLAYLLNIAALGMVEPTVVSIYIYLQPLIVTGLSICLAYMGYVNYSVGLNFKTLMAASAIFIGVWLVSVPRDWLKERIKL